MKKLLALLFSVSICISYSQVTSYFYIQNSNDDADEVWNHKPVFERDFIKLGNSAEGEKMHTGLRFQNVTIPKGSEILSAYIQFTASHDIDDTVFIQIQGEKNNNAAPFENTQNEIFLRPPTLKSVTWITQNWQFFTPGPDQKTPDIKEIIEEIINQDGWASGNAMHIKMKSFKEGNDSLAAMSYEYQMGEWYAPQLMVEYINWSNVHEQFETSKISIYPNPATDEFNLDLRIKEKGHFFVSIIDLTGKEVFQVYDGQLDVGDQKMCIPVVKSGLQAGVYFISVIGEKGKVTRKLIIKK